MSIDVARAAFNQADTNRDGTLDRNEFSQFAAGGLTGGYRARAGLTGATSYETSSYNRNGYGAGAGLVGVGYGPRYGGYGGATTYELSSYESAGGYGAGAGLGVAGGQRYGASSSSYSSQAALQAYPTDAQGLYLDSNPQIIRRPAAGGVQTYTQNIRVRFLQPPPVPPPGPLIIKEVRPPQPRAPLPLRIRQQAPPYPLPLPLVLREHPPQPPPIIPSQTVIRRLAALPVPPRSVIIERLPPLPPRPRDIIIERWIPYRAQAKRRTIVQRAPPAQPYPRPRNLIIQYEQAPVRVLRQFQRLGVTPANPQIYLQQFGGSLLDPATLVQQARSAGVVEDISPPVFAPIGYSAATYGQENLGLSSSSYESSGNTLGGSYDGYGVGVPNGYDAGLVGGPSSYESSSYAASTGYVGDGGYVALDGAGFGGGYQAPPTLYETNSYAPDVAGFLY